MSAFSRPLQFLCLLLLVAGCRHVETSRQVSDQELRQHILGTWKTDGYVAQDFPFTVTFESDGRWQRLGPERYTPLPRGGFWRASQGALLLTHEPNALPKTNLEMFIPLRFAEDEIVFGHPSAGDRIKFKK